MESSHKALSTIELQVEKKKGRDRERDTFSKYYNPTQFVEVVIPPSTTRL
jgi:hypothetical protein